MNHTKTQLIRWLESELQRRTGRRYQIDFDALDAHSLREMQRLIRDMEHEQRLAANRARLQPWRR